MKIIDSKRSFPRDVVAILGAVKYLTMTDLINWALMMYSDFVKLSDLIISTEVKIGVLTV